MKTKVQVKDLRKGDVLSAGSKILSATPVQNNPMYGVNKIMLGVEFPNGKIQTRYWGKYTTVTVTNR